MAEVTEIKKRDALSGWPMLFAWLGMIIFALHASTRMVGAGDTWVAMACGRHFLNHGVDTVEPFSANSHKAGPTEQEVKTWPKWAQWITDKVGLETVRYWHPTGWVNQNWLTHVIFYWLSHKSPFADAESLSFNTLVYWKFAIYIMTVICVYYTGRLLGVNGALSAAFACFAMFVGRSFLDIRPAGFSNLLVAVFLLILVLTTYRNIFYIWLIVPVSVFWCNVHGGYIYIFIMLVPFVVLNFLTSFSKKAFVSVGRRGVYHTIAAGFVAFIASIVFNPFHLTNLTHTFAISVSEHAKMWRSINEWHPAFEWGNPVGTSFPLLVLFILGIGLPILWLFSRFLKPKLLKAPRKELERQGELFTKLLKVFGCTLVVYACWVTFVGFSFLNNDVVSFFFCGLFMGIVLLSICKNVHFIYLAVLLTLLAVWSADAKVGYTGRYIYPFCLLPVYVIVHILVSMFSEKVKIKQINIVFVGLAAIASLILMVLIFNPFKFQSPVWDLRQFLHLRRPWHPVYEGREVLKYTHLFSVLYILNVISAIVFVTVPYLKEAFNRLPSEIGKHEEAETYQLRKIDLALMAIAGLTIYMAIRSRRFIPIAGIAACPVLAMLIDQMVRTISASLNFHRAGQTQNRLVVSPMPIKLQSFFATLGVVAVLAFGTWWGLKFKRIYLDSWPTDPKLSSMFMRMTASDAKPFYAGNFIKMNKLKGKMFNYWTEGGFIAWAQEPDHETGKTPLQLFMDGRAQAAYQRRAYRVWAEIMFGGQIAGQRKENARARRRGLNADDYREIGRWISEQLKGHKVWIVLMPRDQFSSTFVRGLEHHPDWPLVFFNNKQKLFVDVTTPQGRELFDGIPTGRTIYPDDFSRNLIKAHHLLLSKDKAEKEEGLDCAVRAFSIHPSQASMRKLMFAGRFVELRPRVAGVCKDYSEDFAKNRNVYARQDGYLHKLICAVWANGYLESIAKSRKNSKLAKSYAAEKARYNNQIKQLQGPKRKKW